MKFVCFDRKYLIHISPRPIIRDGEPVAAWCDPSAGKILLSDQIPPHERERCLRHEAWHAWAHEAGITDRSDPEELADQIAAFGDAFRQQIDLTKLSELQPAAAGVVRSAAPARNVFAWRSCGDCQSSVMAGSIFSGPPYWSATYGCWLIDRSMSCDCGATTLWTERCAADGTPLGEIVEHPKPRVRRGEREIAIS